MTFMIQHALDLWASTYSNHAAIRTTIAFLHVGGLLVAGGAAITADREALTARRRAGVTREWLDSFHATHRLVLVGLGVVLASGALMFAADAETYMASRIFWGKMALIALLVVNGAQLVRVEKRARRGDAGAGARMRTFAGVSLTLWLLITLAGAALPNVS